ncbi:MAG: hypothetical protein CK425_06010 [Parachlamydia sp.]|nr:MAG: hypothetical protein CK425_06010 [Parachlamydia sp.]
MNSHSPLSFKSPSSPLPSLCMHEWLAVITILSFLLLLLGVTCKSRFEEKDAIMSEMLTNRPAERLANVQAVTKKRRVSPKGPRKTRTRSAQKKNVKSKV